MIVNRSNIPTKKLEKLIEFCAPKNFELCDITVKNTGEPYSADYHYPKHKSPYIILRIGGAQWFPLSFKIRKDRQKRTGYRSEYSYNSRYEALCFLASHEIFHNYTHRHPKLWHLIYQNLPKCERLADNYAFKKLELYRKLKKQGLRPF